MGKAVVEIGVCRESERKAALRLALSSLPRAHHQPLLDSLGALDGEPLAPFDALVTATKGGRLLAAAWAQPQPGRTASLWPPQRKSRVGQALTEDNLSRLVGLAIERVDASGIAMTQTLLEDEEDPSIRPLVANGFERIATLCYLEWQSASGFDPLDTVSRQATGHRATFEPNADSDPQRLKSVIEATYKETLDCPGLEGARNLDDALRGYRHVGDYDPALWFYVRQERHERDAGVLLLAEHKASRQLELVYMGIVPEARGQQLGLAAVRQAQAITSQRRLERVVLAVDAANGPAIATYAEAGFSDWAQRIVYVRRGRLQAH